MDTKQLKQKILDLAIRGKLVPQDPNDEPASVLLERIRAEKEQLIAQGKLKKSKSKISDKPHYENVPFEIPESWEWVTLRELCSKFSTGPFGSMVHKSDYVTTNGVYLVNPANIINGRIVTDKIMAVSYQKAADLKCYRLNEGDILLARRGDLSKCAIVKKSNIDWLCGTGSFFLHLVFVIPSYFSLLYATEYVQSILQNKSVGATMDNLNQDTLGTLLFPLPPLAEQQRIVTEVEKWFALIDELEANKEDLKEYIKQVKNKVLDLAIHGKLVPQAPNDEPAIELLKRINPNFKPCDTSHYENVPAGWSVVQLCDIAKTVTGSTPSKNNKSYYGGTFPLYKPSDLDAGRNVNEASEYLSDEGKRISRIIPANSIAICCIGSIGKCGYIMREGTTNQQINTIIPLYNIYPLYIYYFCLSASFVQQLLEKSSAVTIAIVNKSKLDSTFILLPPLAEQKRIAEQIETIFASLDTITAEL